MKTAAKKILTSVILISLMIAFVLTHAVSSTYAQGTNESDIYSGTSGISGNLKESVDAESAPEKEIPAVKLTANGKTTDYPTMAAAVRAVNETDAEAVIEVQRDIDLKKPIHFTIGKTVKIISAGDNKYTIRRTGFTESVITGETVILERIILDGNKGTAEATDDNESTVQITGEGSLILDNAELNNNKTTSSYKNGGAVCAPKASVIVKNGSVIKGNETAGCGGAIYAKTVVIEDSIIEGNVAGEGHKDANSVYGGAIYGTKITVTTTNDETTKEEYKKTTKITGNVANGGRGGAIAMDSEDGELIIEGNTVITENATQEDEFESFTAGGAIFIKNGKATIKGNTEITKNTAGGKNGFGGAIGVGKDVKGDLCIEENAKITDNHADAAGGGIRLNVGTSKVYVKDNACVTGNTAPLGKNLYIEDSEKKAERLVMSGSLTENANIGVRVAGDEPNEGVVFAKTDVSFKGEDRIVSDKNSIYTGEKDENGNLYWHETGRKTVPILVQKAETSGAVPLRSSLLGSPNAGLPAPLASPSDASIPNNTIVVNKKTVGNEPGKFDFVVNTDKFVNLADTGLEATGSFVDSGFNVIGVQPLGPGPDYTATGGLAIGSGSTVPTYTGSKYGFAIHIGVHGTNGSISMPFMYNDLYTIKFIKPSGDYVVGDKPDNTWDFSCYFYRGNPISISTDDNYRTTVALDNGEIFTITIPAPIGTHQDGTRTWWSGSSLGPIELVYDNLIEGEIDGWKFTLQNGESKELANLPDGYQYTIKEVLTQEQLNDRWSLIDVTGGSVADGFVFNMNTSGAETTFTNKKEPIDNTVVVSKKAEGGDGTEEFGFTLDVDKPVAVAGTSGMTPLAYAEGTPADFILQGIAGSDPHRIPIILRDRNDMDIFYTIYFKVPSGQEWNRKDLPDNNWTIEFDSGSSVATFFNIDDVIDIRSDEAANTTYVTVKTGETYAFPMPYAETPGGDRTVWPDGDNGKIMKTTYPSSWGFTLKGGESKTITGIPDGTIYTITEQDTTGWRLKDITFNTDGLSRVGDTASVTGTMAKAGQSVIYTNTYETPTSITFDCDDFIKIMRVAGMSSDENILPSSKEIGVLINNKPATTEQITALIKNAEYEKYSFIEGNFVKGGGEVFELTQTTEAKLKITAKKSSIVKIKFKYEGAEYTQIVCTPGDVTGEQMISMDDVYIINEYVTLGALDDAYTKVKYTYNGVTYDMFKIMADMRTQNLRGNISVTKDDVYILREMFD